MALDERYILDVTLGPSILDKETGLPLSGGTVYFYEDTSRNTLKPVYELAGTPGNYSYAVLPNPITLNAAGQLQDADENHVAIYYYPYDSFDNLDLYYIEVYAQGDSPGMGTPQFTREAWPNSVGSQNPAASNNSVTNLLSNPQFHDVLFDTSAGLTINYTSAGKSVEIAPGWYIDITASASGSLTVNRTAIAGTTFIPTNPPYTLDIAMGANLTSVQLRQRLNNNPAIWGPINNVGGFLASSITVNTGTQVSMIYRPSTPGASADQTILGQTNLTGAFDELRETVQLTSVANTETAAAGYVDIIVDLPTSGTPRITSVQVAPVSTNEEIAYEQAPVNRQKDRLFNFYQSPLEAKRIPSWLVGWDFPMNPAQWGSTFSAAATGANTSNYVWDQTIVFQSVDSGFSVARTATGSLELTIAQNDTQVAFVQYLEQEKARELLNGRLSVNLAINKSAGGNVLGTVSLWYTDDMNLPDMASNNSIVATLDANGKPATQNGNWTEVGRSDLGDAQFTVSASSTTQFNDIPLKGWNEAGAGAASTATYFAIVVGFAEMDAAESIDVESISLTPGSIPTRPAAQTESQALLDCQRYYWKTFEPGTAPAQNVGADTGEFRYTVTIAGSSNNYAPSIYLPSIMRIEPTVTFYNPQAANALARNLDAAGDASATDFTNGTLTQNNLSFRVAGQAGWTVGQRLGVHLVADSRLGIT